MDYGLLDRDLVSEKLYVVVRDDHINGVGWSIGDNLYIFRFKQTLKRKIPNFYIFAINYEHLLPATKLFIFRS